MTNRQTIYSLKQYGLDPGSPALARGAGVTLLDHRVKVLQVDELSLNGDQHPGPE